MSQQKTGNPVEKFRALVEEKGYNYTETSVYITMDIHRVYAEILIVKKGLDLLSDKQLELLVSILPDSNNYSNTSNFLNPDIVAEAYKYALETEPKLFFFANNYIGTNIDDFKKTYDALRLTKFPTSMSEYARLSKPKAILATKFKIISKIFNKRDKTKNLTIADLMSDPKKQLIVDEMRHELFKDSDYIRGTNREFIDFLSKNRKSFFTDILKLSNDQFQTLIDLAVDSHGIPDYKKRLKNAEDVFDLTEDQVDITQTIHQVIEKLMQKITTVGEANYFFVYNNSLQSHVNSNEVNQATAPLLNKLLTEHTDNIDFYDYAELVAFIYRGSFVKTKHFKESINFLIESHEFLQIMIDLLHIAVSGNLPQFNDDELLAFLKDSTQSDIPILLSANLHDNGKSKLKYKMIHSVIKDKEHSLRYQFGAKEFS